MRRESDDNCIIPRRLPPRGRPCPIMETKEAPPPPTHHNKPPSEARTPPSLPSTQQHQPQQPSSDDDDGKKKNSSKMSKMSKRHRLSNMSGRKPLLSAEKQKSAENCPETAKLPNPNDLLVKELNSLEWYHGLMPREEIEEQLQNEGDFVLRKTDVDGKTKYAISVMCEGQFRHVLLVWKKKKQLWALNGRKEKSIDLLAKHFMTSRQSVMKNGPAAILVNPVRRPDFYILPENIVLGKRFGGGAFGDVFIGTLVNGEQIKVAVKRLKGAITEEDRSTYIKEAKTMRPLKHENIVQLWGVAPNEKPIMIVLELASGGVLKSYLQKHPNLFYSDLSRYTADAANRMTYLASKKIIHRDIAARNYLLGSKDEVKISDFGLSDTNKDTLKVQMLKKMPMKWLAPEVFRTVSMVAERHEGRALAGIDPPDDENDPIGEALSAMLAEVGGQVEPQDGCGNVGSEDDETEDIPVHMVLIKYVYRKTVNDANQHASMELPEDLTLYDAVNEIVGRHFAKGVYRVRTAWRNKDNARSEASPRQMVKTRLRDVKVEAELVILSLVVEFEGTKVGHLHGWHFVGTEHAERCAYLKKEEHAKKRRRELRKKEE